MDFWAQIGQITAAITKGEFWLPGMKITLIILEQLAIFTFNTSII